MSEHSLWQFSTHHWQNKSLQHTLLALQNHAEQAINLWLFSAWLALEKKQRLDLYLEDAISCVEQSQRTILEPLRAIRFMLDADDNHIPKHNNKLRAAILKAELEAEKLEQDQLFGLTRAETLDSPSSDTDTSPSDLLIINIDTLCKSQSKRERHIPKHLVMSLVHNLVPELSLENIKKLMSER